LKKKKDFLNCSRNLQVARPRRTKMLRPQKTLQSIKSLKLREGVYKQLSDREWIFNRAEKEMIFLIHKSGAFGVVVKVDDIDWNEG
jgi:hypothetical protein